MDPPRIRAAADRSSPGEAPEACARAPSKPGDHDRKDPARIFHELTRRNAVRGQAGLPLLDLRLEFDRAMRLEAWRDYRARRALHEGCRAAIEAEVLAARRGGRGDGLPTAPPGGYSLRLAVERRFDAHLESLGIAKPSPPGRHVIRYGGGSG